MTQPTPPDFDRLHEQLARQYGMGQGMPPRAPEPSADPARVRSGLVLLLAGVAGIAVRALMMPVVSLAFARTGREVYVVFAGIDLVFAVVCWVGLGRLASVHDNAPAVGAAIVAGILQSLLSLSRLGGGGGAQFMVIGGLLGTLVSVAAWGAAVFAAMRAAAAIGRPFGGFAAVLFALIGMMFLSRLLLGLMMGLILRGSPLVGWIPLLPSLAFYGCFVAALAIAVQPRA